MIDPHKEKYHPLYWAMAYDAALMSVARRAQVGAVLVLPTGMISVGWNGTPAGFDNECEEIIHDYSNEFGDKTYTFNQILKTKPEVIHAERNCIDKMTRQGVPTQGSVLFVTLEPCIECSKSLVNLGLKAVYYDQDYTDTQAGLALLRTAGVTVHQRPRELRGIRYAHQ